MAVASRTEVLAELLAELDDSGTGALTQLQRARAVACFGTFSDFLVAAYQRWSAGFGARLDQEIEADPADLPGAVRRAWNGCAAFRPGLQRLTTAYADHPAVIAADARQAALLRSTTGVELHRLRADAARELRASAA